MTLFFLDHIAEHTEGMSTNTTTLCVAAKKEFGGEEKYEDLATNVAITVHRSATAEGKSIATVASEIAEKVKLNK